MKIEIRKNCKICGEPLKYRQRTFCCAPCRNKNTNKKRRAYQATYQRERRDKIASIPSDNKVQCLFCGKYYVQVGSHVVQCHGFDSAREYREHFKLEVKRGTVPGWYREMKGKQALGNGTYINTILHGEKHRFKKGQKGIGVYERSPITLKRLSTLYKLNKHKK